MEVPDDVEAGLLVEVMVKRMGLPAIGEDGLPFTYRLDDRDTGQRIGDEETLAQAGVQAQTVLTLLPEVTAGGYPHLLIVVSEFAGAMRVYMTFDPHYPVYLVNLQAVKALRLPDRDVNGRVLQYKLKLRRSDDSFSDLQENESLFDNRIREFDSLVIIPESTTDSLDRESGTRANDAPKPHWRQEWKYQDFEVLINQAGDTYRAAVLASPAGETSEIFHAPEPLEVENFILKISRPRRGVRSTYSPQRAEAVRFGTSLYRRLFYGQIMACLTASLQEVQRRQSGLRIKLRLDGTTQLMSIPWEFLYDPAKRLFMVANEDTPIVRFVNAADVRPTMRTERPLGILAMASSPEELLPLNVMEERRKVEQALQPMIAQELVTVDWVEGGSLAALSKHLLYSEKKHYVFHFIGHGGFDEATQQGFLAMEGAGGRADEVTGERLAPLLMVRRRRFRLAILNACEGARTGQIDPFASVATSLVRACNFPAVVAMQFEISDRAAITFATNFYGALATGRPVDTAVTSARLAIWAEQNDVEWATPVLYMRSPDGRLFDFTSAGT